MRDDLDALADRMAIVQLTHDYCWALDTGEWDELREVFAPDVEADLGAGGQNGVDEVIARVSSALGKMDASQHNVSTHQIRVDGDTATGRCYVIAQHVRNKANWLLGGIYHDRYARTADGWRIVYRRIETIWTEGDTDVMRKP